MKQQQILSREPRILPPSWKSAFADKEVIVIKGIGFYVAAVNRRGITLRKVKNETAKQIH